MVKLLFFRFQVTNSMSKKKKNSLRVTNPMSALSFSHIQVTIVKLINEKDYVDIPIWMFVNPLIHTLLRPLRTSCPGIAQAYSKVNVARMWSPTDGNLSYLCVGTASLLVSEIFQFKNFETWLPATYNNGYVVKN